MAIRPVEVSDFDAFADITNFYIRTTAIHFAYEPVSAAEFRAVWEKSRALYPYLALTSESGTIIGYAKAGRWRERTAYDRTAEVGIYLHPDHCGRGHGKALYRALIDACRKRRFHSLIGGIALPNPASIKLHESLGFVHTGTVRQAGFKFDRWHDVGFWQLLLE